MLIFASRCCSSSPVADRVRITTALHPLLPCLPSRLSLPLRLGKHASVSLPAVLLLIYGLAALACLLHSSTQQTNRLMYACLLRMDAC